MSKLTPDDEAAMISDISSRRRWSDDDRAKILAEALAPGTVVSAVARRYGLAPQQLFNWRREARKRAGSEILSLVDAVVVAGPEPMDPAERKPSEKQRREKTARPVIELEVSGIIVRIDNGVSPTTIAAVIGALKGVP